MRFSMWCTSGPSFSDSARAFCQSGRRRMQPRRLRAARSLEAEDVPEFVALAATAFVQ